MIILFKPIDESIYETIKLDIVKYIILVDNYMQIDTPRRRPHIEMGQSQI